MIVFSIIGLDWSVLVRESSPKQGTVFVGHIDTLRHTIVGGFCQEAPITGFSGSQKGALE